MTTRAIAVQALSKIFAAVAGASHKPKEVLETLSGQLDDRERSFLMEIVYGVLRYRDCLDWILAKFLDKPSSLPPDTMNNLRIAVYQIKFMRVPEWAAGLSLSIWKLTCDKSGCSTTGCPAVK